MLDAKISLVRTYQLIAPSTLHMSYFFQNSSTKEPNNRVPLEASLFGCMFVIRNLCLGVYRSIVSMTEGTVMTKETRQRAHVLSIQRQKNKT